MRKPIRLSPIDSVEMFEQMSNYESGKIMQSDVLLLYFQNDVSIEEHRRSS